MATDPLALDEYGQPIDPDAFRTEAAMRMGYAPPLPLVEGMVAQNEYTDDSGAPVASMAPEGWDPTPRNAYDTGDPTAPAAPDPAPARTGETVFDPTVDLLNKGYTPEQLAGMSPRDRAIASLEVGRSNADRVQDEADKIMGAVTTTTPVMGGITSAMAARYPAAAEAAGIQGPALVGVNDTAAPATAVEDPAAPRVQYTVSRGSPGRTIPGGEVPGGRTEQIDRAIPMSDEAIGLQNEAFIHREDQILRESEAARERAKVERSAAIGAMEAEQAHNARMQRLAQEHMAEREYYRQQYEAADIDPDKYWEKKGTGARILGAIAVALGAIGASRGGPNYALNLIQKEIDRDISAQRENRAATKSSMDALPEKHASESADLSLKKAQALRAVQMKVAQLGAGAEDKELEAKIAGLLVPLREAEARFADEYAQRMADKVVEQRRFNYQPERYVGGSAPRINVSNKEELYRSWKAAGGKDDDFMAHVRNIESGGKNAETSFAVLNQYANVDAPADPKTADKRAERLAGLYVSQLNGFARSTEDAKKVRETEAVVDEYNSYLDELERLRSQMSIGSPIDSSKALAQFKTQRAAGYAIGRKWAEAGAALSDAEKTDMVDPLVRMNPLDPYFSTKVEAARRAAENKRASVRGSVTVTPGRLEQDPRTGELVPVIESAPKGTGAGEAATDDFTEAGK